MFRLEMLPADHGDCLWIEYGDPNQPRRLLVDGGTTGTYRAVAARLDALAPEERLFELLIVTHVDADHISGVLRLIDAKVPGLLFADVWFNGYRHLVDLEEFGPVQGEKLTTWLLRPGARWNAAFGSRAVVVADSGVLPATSLVDGLTLTVIGPTRDKLTLLHPVWEKECRIAGLDPSVGVPPPEPAPPGLEFFGPPDIDALANSAFEEDDAVANGSSISLLLEFEGRRVLLGADAHPTTLLATLDRLAPGGCLEVDAFKLPHHGSKYNVSRQLLARIRCDFYLFSTNGTHFSHPDLEAVARVIKFGAEKPHLLFNYKTRYNRMWNDESLQSQHGYLTRFAEKGEGLVLEL